MLRSKSGTQIVGWIKGIWGTWEWVRARRRDAEMMERS